MTIYDIAKLLKDKYAQIILEPEKFQTRISRSLDHYEYDPPDLHDKNLKYDKERGVVYLERDGRPFIAHGIDDIDCKDYYYDITKIKRLYDTANFLGMRDVPKKFDNEELCKLVKDRFNQFKKTSKWQRLCSTQGSVDLKPYGIQALQTRSCSILTELVRDYLENYDQVIGSNVVLPRKYEIQNTTDVVGQIPLQYIPKLFIYFNGSKLTSI